MYAVIFRAELAELDDQYAEMSARLRKLAFEKYGCLDLVSVTEDNLEVTISYWKSLEAIERWRQDAEHIVAKEMARKKWYKWHRLQIVEVMQEYGSGR
ncbi:MAG: DUF4188 domain-containing protein [bacterium]